MPNGIFTLKQQVDGLRQGAWTNQKTPFVNYLVVAGGAGGGLNGGAGGGAGGLLQGVVNVAAGSAITTTVGAGGAAGSGGNPGGNGANSVFGVIASTGGGGGGYGANPANAGVSGGSGGGSASYDNVPRVGAQGIAGQGNKGGDGVSLGANQFSSSGGGGAGTAGLNPVANLGGNGGAGIASDISGTRTAYAGGGAGGGNSYPTNYGNGGAGGGGGASTSQNGTANTGGGGANGSGGSGIVIISYPDVYQAPTATTGSPTVSTSGSGSVLFTRASGQFLSYANPSSQFSFGTGALTIECWVRLVSMPSGTGYPSSYWLFGGGPVNSDAGIDFYINNTQIGFNLGFFTAPTAIANHGMTTNTWYHVAVVRGGASNQTVSIYVNGTRLVTATGVTASADPASTGVSISAAEPTGATAGNLDGYISNHRVVKGTAIYDPTQASLTVPTSPLTAVTNTQLLLNTMSGAFSADSSANGLPTIATSSVSPAWNQLSPFTVTGFKNRVYTWTSSGSITF